jgi:hypothetical protein
MADAHDNDTVADLVRAAVDNVLKHVDLQNAEPEFAVVWWPKGRAVTAVNLTVSGGTSLDRSHEALEVAVAQIEASKLA